MVAIAYRPLRSADADEAADVIRAAFAAQPRPTRPPSSALRETAAAVAAKIEGGGAIGASFGGRLVALALWRIDEGALEVGRVSVLPAWRGRGPGRALMAECEAEAKGRGVSRMTLRVRLELPEHAQLFERLGFERRELAAHEGFEAPTQAVMEKSLA